MNINKTYGKTFIFDVLNIIKNKKQTTINEITDEIIKIYSLNPINKDQFNNLKNRINRIIHVLYDSMQISIEKKENANKTIYFLIKSL